MTNIVSQQPRKKDLRQFGFLVGGVFSAIGLWPVLFRGESPRLWAMIIGSALILLGAVLPGSLKQVYAGWMKLGHVLGWVNTRIILGVIYYGLVTPMGLAMRLMGKDSMRLAFREDASTYRVVRAPRPRHHMRNQF